MKYFWAFVYVDFRLCKYATEYFILFDLYVICCRKVVTLYYEVSREFLVYFKIDFTVGNEVLSSYIILLNTHLKPVVSKLVQHTAKL